MSQTGNTMPSPAIQSSGSGLKKAILAFILLLLLSVVTLFYTTAAPQLLLRLVPTSSPLQIKSISGSLSDGVQFNGLQLRQDSFSLNIQQLSAKIRWSCLARFEICLHTAEAQGVQLELVPSAAEHTASEPEAPPPQLPDISVEQLQITKLSIQQGELRLDLQSLNTALTLKEQQIRLGKTGLEQLQLHLPEPPTQSMQAAQPKHSVQSGSGTTHWWDYQRPELSPLALPLWLSISELTLQQLQVTGAYEISAQQLHLSLETNPNQLKLNRLTVTQLQFAQPDLQTAPLDLEAQLSVSNAAPFALQGELQASSAGLELNSRITGSAERMQLTAELSGNQKATASLDIAPLTAGLPIQLQLNASSLRWPLSGESLYHIQQLQLEAEGALADLRFKAQSQQQWPQVPDSNLSLTGQWQAPLLSWSSARFNSAVGNVTSQGTLDISKQLALKAAVSLQSLQMQPWFKEYPGQLSGDMTVHASYHDKLWQLELPALNISGLIRQQPLSLTGQLFAKGKALDVESLSSKNLTLRHGGNKVTAQGDVTDQWHVALAVEASDLSGSIQGAQGSLMADVKVKGPRQQPAFDLSLQGEKLRYKKWLRLQALDLTAQINSHTLDHQLQLGLGKGSVSGQPLNSAQLLLAGNKNGSDLILQLDGADYKAQFQAAATATPKQQWQIELQQAQLQTPVGHWALVDAIVLALNEQSQQLIIPAHCWRSEPGELCLEQDTNISSAQGDISVRLRQFQLALLEPLFDSSQQLAGEADASLQLGWGKKQGLTAKLQLTGSQGKWQQMDVNPLQLPWQSWNGELTLASQKLSAQWQIQFSQERQLRGSVTLPDLSQQDKKLEAELSLSQLDLSFLRTLLPEQSEFTAALNGQLRASGTLSRPLLSGQIKVSDIRLQGNNAPLDIEQGSLQLDFLQQKALLTADIQSGEGKAQLSGYADWFNFANYQVHLALSGQQLPLNLPQGIIYIHPEITLLAQNQVVAVQGTVQIPKADLAIDDLPQNAVQISDDEILLNKELEVRRGAASSAIRLVTEMRLILGEQVKLQAFGLKSRLKGQLLFSQDGPQQRLKGEVNILDGTFRSYGQDLQIRKGKLMFNGPVDQPYLAIEAIRNPSSTEDDVIAGIRVNGPADQASVVIFSEPSKPQANALSYLLMGRDLAAGSNNKNNPLTSGLIGLGIANSNGMVSQLGKAFGFEQFTLDTAGSGDDSQVTVSGYLSPKLQLKYGVGIFNSLGEFTLRYELMKNLYLEAVQGLDSAVDVLYKFEFD